MGIGPAVTSPDLEGEVLQWPVHVDAPRAFAEVALELAADLAGTAKAVNGPRPGSAYDKSSIVMSCATCGCTPVRVTRRGPALRPCTHHGVPLRRRRPRTAPRHIDDQTPSGR